MDPPSPKNIKKRTRSFVAKEESGEVSPVEGCSSSPPLKASKSDKEIAELAKKVRDRRSEIQSIINTNLTKGEKSRPRVDKSNSNLEMARVKMKDGRVIDYYAFSGMSRLRSKARKKNRSAFASKFVPSVTKDTAFIPTISNKGVQWDNHTEPKLLNYIIANLDVSQIESITLVGEMAPCADSCSHTTLPNFAKGEVYKPAGGKKKIDTSKIELKVFDTSGTEYKLRENKEKGRSEFSAI